MLKTHRYTWWGHLADDNVEYVAQRIENLLGGRRYTFVSTNASFPNTPPDVRTSQRLEPSKHVDKRSPAVYRIGEVRRWSEKPSDFCGITCSDTYGVWGINSNFATEADAVAAAADEAKVKQTTYVVIEGGREAGDIGRNSRVEIRQYNGYGEVLHWVIAPEHPKEED